jgi:REP element-mobilizing transposase RayT
MARPTRLELAGAAYYVSAHCPRQGAAARQAFSDESDHAALLALLGQVCHRFDAQVLAYCLLPDHYHLVLFTRQANLSKLMRHLNGVYSQHYQSRHGGAGGLFGGRFKAVLVDRERHLLDACRYVELNPVRLGLARSAEAWAASSYRAHAGQAAAPEWLDVDGLHAFVAGRPVDTPAQHRAAAERYARLVAAEPGLQLWPGRLRQQIFLGDAAFAARMQALAARPSRAAAKAKTWADWLRTSANRGQALYRAHVLGGLSMTALAGELGLSVSRVSRLVAVAEREAAGMNPLSRRAAAP